MRTWQQLTAAAESTGTWQGYVGDGASIPWETCGIVNPPLGLSMLAYKLWLDASYPEAFRLHDWLYTPYGGLITATQGEADEALAAQIIAIGGLTAPLDSAVVFAAVYLLGSYYFGISGTGFDQAVFDEANARIFPSQPGANIPLPPGKARSPMQIKVIVIFQQVTLAGASIPSLGLAGRQHIGGWSESFWYSGSGPDDLWKQLTVGPSGVINWGFLPVRADLLTAQASIVGVRTYADGTGKGNFRAVAYPGTYANASTDIPQMALLAYMGLTGSTKARRMIIRGIPDTKTSGGEFNPDSQYTTSLLNYGGALAGLGAITKNDSAGLKILTVSSAGVVQLDGVAVPFSVGQGVTFRSVLNASGQRVGGVFAVTAVVGASNQFTVAGWPHGNCTGGNCLIPATSFKTFVTGSLTISRLLTRKVGRPFEQYRGRRSKRR